ncbi:MAG: methionyl aminopeptidase [Lachnospira sp.]
MGTKKYLKDELCWCNSGKKYCECHMEYDKKIEMYRKKFHKVPPRSIIKNEEQLNGMRESSKINIAVLDYVGEHIKEGMTTAEIDKMVYDVTTGMGGIPAPLNYEGFPKSVCTSINEQVCHGIPSENIQLVDGDIINVDCSTILNGYYSDSSRMFCIGNVKPEHKKLVQVAKECVELGLKQVKPWGHLGDVAHAICEHAHANGCTVVREVGGHGIGLEFHETPFVSYVIKKGTGMLMVPGMVFTIEPMINLGGPDIYIDDDNGWTIYTDDDSYSAQWEIMVLVTEDGYEVMAY